MVLLRSRTFATSCLEKKTVDVSFSDGLVAKYPRLRGRAHIAIMRCQCHWRPAACSSTFVGMNFGRIGNVVLVACVAAVGVVSATVAVAASASTYSQSAPLTPRWQWDPNYGYCGEVSMIVAGMRVGQYTSQWTARSLAAPRINQTLEASQLLIGTSPPDGNAVTAAAGMRLNLLSYDSANGASTPAYLAWVKQHFLAGNTVIIGVLNNVTMLGEYPPGDTEYDHIVPVMGIGSDQPFTAENAATYFPTDTLTISDNGLYVPRGKNVPGNSSGNPRGSSLYTYPFAEFQKTRAQANKGRGANSLYSVAMATGTSLGNYAVAVTGVTDNSPGGPFVVPVALASTSNNEGFPTADPMAKPPAAKRTTITATVTLPDATEAYRLYEYTRFSAVPRGNFNAAAVAHPSDVTRSWDIPAGSGSTYTVKLQNVSTAGTYVFRAVPVSAP